MASRRPIGPSTGPVRQGGTRAAAAASPSRRRPSTKPSEGPAPSVVEPGAGRVGGALAQDAGEGARLLHGTPDARRGLEEGVPEPAGPPARRAVLAPQRPRRLPGRGTAPRGPRHGGSVTGAPSRGLRHGGSVTGAPSRGLRHGGFVTGAPSATASGRASRAARPPRRGLGRPCPESPCSGSRANRAVASMAPSSRRRCRQGEGRVDDPRPPPRPRGRGRAAADPAAHGAAGQAGLPDDLTDGAPRGGPPCRPLGAGVARRVPFPQPCLCPGRRSRGRRLRGPGVLAAPQGPPRHGEGAAAALEPAPHGLGGVDPPMPPVGQPDGARGAATRATTRMPGCRASHRASHRARHRARVSALRSAKRSTTRPRSRSQTIAPQRWPRRHARSRAPTTWSAAPASARPSAPSPRRTRRRDASPLACRPRRADSRAPPEARWPRRREAIHRVPRWHPPRIVVSPPRSGSDRLHP